MRAWQELATNCDRDVIELDRKCSDIHWKPRLQIAGIDETPRKSTHLQNSKRLLVRIHSPSERCGVIDDSQLRVSHPHGPSLEDARRLEAGEEWPSGGLGARSGTVEATRERSRVRTWTLQREAAGSFRAKERCLSELEMQRAVPWCVPFSPRPSEICAASEPSFGGPPAVADAAEWLVHRFVNGIPRLSETAPVHGGPLTAVGNGRGSRCGSQAA
ncbi:hypothetical protein C8Q80DRAFT_57901 [Daedaleopsis nitida]|nr:hypothetical protein C8Q80DRAFT_57901 [Daedaleopsis nitida]